MQPEISNRKYQYPGHKVQTMSEVLRTNGINY
jgi:hypothetical protein